MIQGKLDWNPEIKGQSLALAFSSCGNMEFMISTLTFDRCRNLGPDMKSSIRAPEFYSPSKNQVTKGNTLPFCPLLLLLKHGFIDLRVSSNESFISKTCKVTYQNHGDAWQCVLSESSTSSEMWTRRPGISMHWGSSWSWVGRQKQQKFYSERQEDLLEGKTLWCLKHK